MSDGNHWNSRMIEEFRANGGKVGGPFEGAPMLLLHTTGAKTGEARVNPMVYRADGDKMVVFASYGGAPKNPAWFHNLMAGGPASIEVGTDTFPVSARVTEGAERDTYWSKQKQDMPGFAEYERKTTREIPVVVLERVT
jgi:deazaflavin-dependent oxidoreductase (nitroreductase family)